MEYRNLIEELMDTKVKGLFEKPFDEVMNITGINGLNINMISASAEILECKLWCEIFMDNRVESIRVLEKWENSDDGIFLVLSVLEDGVMQGLYIDDEGMVEYKWYDQLIRESNYWEMKRLTGEKLGNYFALMNEAYFEDWF